MNNDQEQKRNDSITSSIIIKNNGNFEKILIKDNNKEDQIPENNNLIKRSYSLNEKSMETLRSCKHKDKSYFLHYLEKQEHENNNYSRCHLMEISLKKQVKDSKAVLPKMVNKKMLSDMVFNMRKLSKSLGDTRIMLEIRNILIITKTHDKSLILLTRKLVVWLLSYQSNFEKKYSVYVNSTFKDYNDFDSEGIIKSNISFKNYLKYWTFELCRKHASLFDFIITLGGDGTVLFSSWLFQRIVPPVISFSLGSLGFLTMFDFSMFDNTLDNIFNHGVIVSLRMRFKCTIMRVKVNNGQLVDEIKNLDQSILENKKNGMSVTHEPKESFLILNDLVVDRGPNAFLSSLELYGDYKHLTSVQADGICISTPTGSTAYSLSAGGSLCHPDIPAILISPICPHTLSFRPLLVHDSMILHVAVPYNARSTAWVSFDGRNRVEIKQGDYVTISASRFPFPIVHRSKQSSDWFTGLATRLGWNERSMKPKPLSN
ncbi:uncharacterized protein T551_00058 [Pneumocystis jirovecii RU7]|uniref:NAD+ kinase n=1 Tax=Pneumocystis jirovecii (strain RU7) TaxID=1408657 RepID=A0A0W4ZW32_PNEJ7|nr:uncharacterized protein T551_00058 [Pneumocystis jirovecii RU7]KTW32573.1 hypothetical protein T551_00058 [Pneumocystis jirovecii RU7]